MGIIPYYSYQFLFPSPGIQPPGLASSFDPDEFLRGRAHNYTPGRNQDLEVICDYPSYISGRFCDDPIQETRQGKQKLLKISATLIYSAILLLPVH